MSINSTKICTKCQESKTLESFSKNKCWCKQCEKDYRQRPEVKQAHFENQIKRYYNLGIKQYNEMFDLQQGKCAICRIPERELKQKLCIDHNHITGEVRGLLCDNCNRGIGCLKDSPQILAEAINYLSK